MSKTNAPVIPYNQVYTYLDRAQQLLSAPCPFSDHSWIKGMLAMRRDGRGCEPESDLAVAYCEVGAVKAVTHYDNDPDAACSYVISILHAANAQTISKAQGPMGGIPAVNDAHATTFEHVIKMFERAKAFTLKLQGTK